MILFVSFSRQGHQAALAVAAAEAERLRTDMEATRDSLETALQEKATMDALLRTKQGREGGPPRKKIIVNGRKLARRLYEENAWHDIYGVCWWCWWW